jgi:hypothetical protein
MARLRCNRKPNRARLVCLMLGLEAMTRLLVSCASPPFKTSLHAQDQSPIQTSLHNDEQSQQVAQSLQTDQSQEFA